MDSQPRRPRPARPDRDARLRAAVIDLSRPERTTLDAVAGRLIPADETGPGAREAGVVEYIERSLAGEYAKHGAAYAAGLAELGAAGFASLPEGEQDAMLEALERRNDPFFLLVRRHVIEGMFGDPGWGGNAERVGWELLGYPGPRQVWTEDDQQLGVEPQTKGRT